jgi:hypothetical protein
MKLAMKSFLEFVKREWFLLIMLFAIGIIVLLFEAF